VVSLDAEGVASYTFHFNNTANFGWQIDDLPELAADDWLHIASLSCVVSPGAEVLLEWMRDVKAGVSYDINVRPTVITDPETYWGKVQPWLRAVGRRRGRRTGRQGDPGRGVPDQGGGHRRCRRHVHGRLPRRAGQARAESRGLPSAWGGGGIDRLLAAGRPASHLGRGGRPDRGGLARFSYARLRRLRSAR